MQIEIKEELVLPGPGATRKRSVRKKYTRNALFELKFYRDVQKFVGL